MEQNSAFWKDFAEAQATMPHCVLDSVNPHFKSKFASLAAVMKVAHHFMARGFAITQSISINAGDAVRAVTLIAKDGTQTFSESPSFPVTKKDAQGYASACTYARRIGMQLALGIVGQEDDDGNAAVAEPVKAATIPPAAKQAAQLGRDSFGTYWKGLDAAQRASLKPYLPDLKQIAEAA